MADTTNNQVTRQSLELLYNISRELAAALDIHTVLQRVLFLSMKNTNAISGSIIVLDDNSQPIESAIIIGETLHEHTTEQLRVTFEHGLAGWVAKKKQAVLVPDTSNDERWLRRPDDAEDRTGAKSAVSAPILVRDKLIGVITLVNPQPGFFQPDHLDLVQAIADQAGIAILNARLYTESQRRAEVMTALSSSANAITGSLNLEEVVQRILDQSSQALRVEVVSLALIDHQSNELVFRASTEKHRQNVVGIRLKMGQGVAGWVAREGISAVVPDTSQDDRFYDHIDNVTGFQTRAIACAPIRWRGQVIGILEALNPVDNVFEPDAILVLSGIGGLAGTAIRHAQLFEDLQAAHQRYHELFESNIDAILITNWQGIVNEANRQAAMLTGYNENELRTLTLDQLGVVNFDLVGANYSVLSTGETISYETQITATGRKTIPVHVYARKVHIEGIPYLQWILHDITERKNMETMRNDLISMIYHDLRSPLANVVSSLDVLETLLPLDDEKALKSLLNIAIRSTERIQRLTNSLLDMQRLEVGQAVTNPHIVCPLSLIHETIEAVKSTAETKKQTISIHTPDQIPPIWADEDMIRRVLINLFENAIKYTPQGSFISVGVEQRGEWVETWVKDNGPGIPASEHERVFEKFTRLQQGATRGFGLGLAYCRLAIKAHGGNIWVESADHSGACFKFTLPIASETGNNENQ